MMIALLLQVRREGGEGRDRSRRGEEGGGGGEEREGRQEGSRYFPSFNI
jgi:hypothetical protein